MSAIAFNAASESSVGSGVSSLTWSHTCTGLERLLAVCVGFRDDAGLSNITGITYNGVALTFARRDDGTSLSFNIQTEIWYLVAPATGANNIIVTFGSTIDNVCAGVGVSLVGVDPVNPIDASNGATGSAGNNDPTVSITTINNGAWILDCAYHADDDGCSVGAGQTERSSRIITGVSADWMGVSTAGPKSPAGTESMNWTGGVDEFWCSSSVAFLPARERHETRRLHQRGGVY